MAGHRGRTWYLLDKLLDMQPQVAKKKRSGPSGPKRRSVRAPVRAFLDALLHEDRAAAFRIADEQLAILGSRAAVFAELIHPAQYEIGELWYRGEIGIDVEHRGTVIVEAIVERLPPAAATAANGRRCVVAAAGLEEHVVGLHMLAAALRDDGWEVTMLGRRTPEKQLLEAVDRIKPRLVCISAGYLLELAPLKRTVAQIKARGIPVLVGGAAFNRSDGLAERVGADAHGQDVRVALTLARRLGGK